MGSKLVESTFSQTPTSPPPLLSGGDELTNNHESVGQCLVSPLVVFILWWAESELVKPSKLPCLNKNARNKWEWIFYFVNGFENILVISVNIQETFQSEEIFNDNTEELCALGTIFTFKVFQNW